MNFPLSLSGPVILPIKGEDSIQIRSVPAWVPEEQLYKLWLYEGRGIGLATSPDGLSWTRPTLRAREHHGTLENNLVSGPCGEQVLYDPSDPDPSMRYKSLQMFGCMERVFSPTPQRWRLPLDSYRYVRTRPSARPRLAHLLSVLYPIPPAATVSRARRRGASSSPPSTPAPSADTPAVKS